MSTALIVIDMQKEYSDSERPLHISGVETVAENVKRLLEFFRSEDMEIIHVRHISDDPDDSTFSAGSSHVEFMDEINVEENEPVVTKTNPGAFHGTDLDRILMSKEVEKVVICGLMSFLCTDTTAREAEARGYETYYVRDTTDSIDLEELSSEEINRVVEAVQDFMFSEVMNTDQIIKKLG
ncbi:MAG: cysteine hydrolase family protein [Candidatus Nanohaloarchaea archaeon]